jgi:hypothetical protein
LRRAAGRGGTGGLMRAGCWRRYEELAGQGWDSGSSDDGLGRKKKKRGGLGWAGLGWAGLGWAGASSEQGRRVPLEPLYLLSQASSSATRRPTSQVSGTRPTTLGRPGRASQGRRVAVLSEPAWCHSAGLSYATRIPATQRASSCRTAAATRQAGAGSGGPAGSSKAVDCVPLG